MARKIDKLISLLLSKNSSIPSICKNEEIEILETGMLSIEGVCISCFDDKFIVLSNSLTELSKDFVTSHELGHALLHDDDLLFLKKNTFFSSRKLEDEANLFAMNLLTGLNKNYEIESEKDLEIIEQINKLK